MAEARDVMDQLTKVVLEARDLEGAAKFLASDVVAVTPGVGQIEGREQLVDYMRQFFDAFPDVQYQSLHSTSPVTRRSTLDATSGRTLDP